VEREFPLVRLRAVLEKVYALPGSKLHLAAADWNRNVALGKRGLDMGRHIVGTLGRMAVEARIFRDQAAKEGLEVMQDVRVGILLDE